MMTGSYPFVHGARDNGVFRLCDENLTLAEMLKLRGYATAAEVATVILNQQYGLNQGFDQYGDVPEAKGSTEAPMLLKVPSPSKAAPSSRPAGKQAQAPPKVERNCEEITGRAIEVLQEKARDPQPFFLFLHYYDPHWPFAAPESFASQFPGSNPYLAEIAYFDSQFGKLMETVARLGLDEKTLVILTSDHGEGRGQHGEYTHAAFLYDSTLHVPLILRCMGLIPAGQVVKSQVRLVDLAPTILEMVGVPNPRGGQIQGTSLVPLLSNPGSDLQLACYSDTIVPQLMYGLSPLRSLRTQNWKYILAPTPELYDLQADPLELFNRAGLSANQPMEMRQQLWDLIQNSPPAPCGRATVQTASSEEADALQALGYVSSANKLEGYETGSELDHFDPKGDNPRDHVEEIELMCTAMGAMRNQKHEAAEILLKRVHKLQPDHRLVASALVVSLAAQAKYEEALPILNRLIEEDPKDGTMWSRKGAILSTLERHKEAEESLKKAVELGQRDSIVFENLGGAMAAQGRYQEALDPMLKALKLAPEGRTSLFNKLGDIKEHLGKLDEAIDLYRRGATSDSTNLLSQSGLARVLMLAGKKDEAIENLQKAVEFVPDAAIFHVQLAQCYGMKGEREKAVAAAQRALGLDPKQADAYLTLGMNLKALNRSGEALEALKKAVEFAPDRVMAHKQLADCLEMNGRSKEALEHYLELLKKWPAFRASYLPASRLALRLKEPTRAIEILNKGVEQFNDDSILANDLAWLLATSSDSRLRDGRRAVKLAERFSALKEHEDPNLLDTLGAAYAEVGQFEKAISMLDHAIELAAPVGDKQLIEDLKSHRELYKRGQPYRSQ